MECILYLSERADRKMIYQSVKKRVFQDKRIISQLVDNCVDEERQGNNQQVFFPFFHYK